jgi:hypothetical protein
MNKSQEVKKNELIDGVFTVKTNGQMYTQTFRWTETNEEAKRETDEQINRETDEEMKRETDEKMKRETDEEMNRETQRKR